MWQLEAEAAFAAHRALVLQEMAQPGLRANGFWTLRRGDVWENFYSTFVRERTYDRCARQS